jgi:hypothetical protein
MEEQKGGRVAGAGGARGVTRGQGLGVGILTPTGTLGIVFRILLEIRINQSQPLSCASASGWTTETRRPREAQLSPGVGPRAGEDRCGTGEDSAPERVRGQEGTGAGQTEHPRPSGTGVLEGVCFLSVSDFLIEMKFT